MGLIFKGKKDMLCRKALKIIRLFGIYQVRILGPGVIYSGREKKYGGNERK